MQQRWKILALITVIVLAFGAFFAWQGTGDRDWGRDDHDIVRTIENPDGSTSTIVIERDGRGFPGFFFFPFGFLLFWGLIFFVARAFFWRGGPPRGDRMRERFNEWHREEHARMDASQ